MAQSSHSFDEKKPAYYTLDQATHALVDLYEQYLASHLIPKKIAPMLRQAASQASPLEKKRVERLQRQMAELKGDPNGLCAVVRGYFFEKDPAAQAERNKQMGLMKKDDKEKNMERYFQITEMLQCLESKESNKLKNLNHFIGLFESTSIANLFQKKAAVMRERFFGLRIGKLPRKKVLAQQAQAIINATPRLILEDPLNEFKKCLEGLENNPYLPSGEYRSLSSIVGLLENGVANSNDQGSFKRLCAEIDFRISLVPTTEEIQESVEEQLASEITSGKLSEQAAAKIKDETVADLLRLKNQWEGVKQLLKKTNFVNTDSAEFKKTISSFKVQHLDTAYRTAQPKDRHRIPQPETKGYHEVDLGVASVSPESFIESFQGVTAEIEKEMDEKKSLSRGSVAQAHREVMMQLGKVMEGLSQFSNEKGKSRWLDENRLLIIAHDCYKLGEMKLPEQPIDLYPNSKKINNKIKNILGGLLELSGIFSEKIKKMAQEMDAGMVENIAKGLRFLDQFAKVKEGLDDRKDYDEIRVINKIEEYLFDLLDRQDLGKFSENFSKVVADPRKLTRATQEILEAIREDIIPPSTEERRTMGMGRGR